MEMNHLLESYGSLTFTDKIMKEKLPSYIYEEFHASIDNDEQMSSKVAYYVADAMKDWAVEHGATHYTHWFTPMTGLTAEKHDAFLEPEGEGVILKFSGKALRKGEPDASSFPTGGLRATFEARGYTAWDCTSPAFIKDQSLYIPTLFYSYTGEALDKKTPLLRSTEALSNSAVKLMNLLGMDDVTSVSASVGAEQEYFLVPDEYYQKRIDLKLTGRTLYGAMAPKGQEMDDHYFGSLKRKVSAFMHALDKELWNYGIPSKTKHNEVAPAQHEVACVYKGVTVTTDNNALLMQLLQDIAKRHGLRCLLHEKPFEGVNGSGKHNNWSITTNTGVNLFNPGKDPINNLPFLATLACTLKAVDEYADLLRMSIATASNDHRLGADEAPPAIISVFLGEDLDRVIESIVEDKPLEELNKERFDTSVNVVPDFQKDNTDRNRTSPFAFTGNKFEFRGVGSSQSIAGPNTILNAMLAQVMNEMSDLINSGKTPMEVIKMFFKDHLRIIFNGNGYSKEWEEEAAKRGLPNNKNTVDALACLKDPKNIKMLKDLGVYSEVELAARYEILLEGYSKTLRVEALTALRMAKTQIYPAAIGYLKEINKTLLELNQTGVQDVAYLKEDVNDLSKLVSQMKSLMIQLEENVKHADDITDVLDKAISYRDDVLTVMNDLRKVADTIELKMPEEKWPMPTYMDLLFGI